MTFGLKKLRNILQKTCRTLLLTGVLLVSCPANTAAQEMACDDGLYDWSQSLTTDYGYGERANNKEEIRAVWLTTVSGLDWPKTLVRRASDIERQKRELTDILDKYVEANINTVLLQTRIRGSVIYPSEIEPWDECLTGVPGKAPGYDPLAFAIEECHKRGLELHTWLVSIPLGKTAKQRGYGRQSITKKRPELCKTSKGEVFMIPGKEGTADYIAAICREITANYDIDGIQLDYIRYPEKLYRFSDENLYSRASGLTKDEWKRENITRIVRRVHNTVKPLKPWVKLSSSPIGKSNNLPRYHSGGWNCFTAVHQDPQAWLRDNLQDFLCPMMYFREDHFYPYLFDWKENSYGHPVVPGLGIYFLDPSEGRWTLNDVRAEMHTARNIGIGGIAFYRSKFLTDNIKGLYSATCNEFFTHPALTPRMTWSGDTIAPIPPAFLSKDHTSLVWTEAEEDNSNGGIIYNVYASDTYPVDVTRVENLIAARVRGTTYEFTSKTGNYCYYAITASDRFGNESEAVQEYVDPTELAYKQERSKRYLPVDDNRMVHFPEEEGTLAVYICDLSGKRIRIATYPDRINVRPIKPGMYKLIRIKKKNRVETIGHVIL